MAHSAAAIYIILVPALFLPHGEVARMMDARPMKFFELRWRTTRCCPYYRHHKMLENVFTLCFMLGQTQFSALDSQTVLILLHTANLPTSSPKELKRKGEAFPHKARHSGQYYAESPHRLVHGPCAILCFHETWAVLTRKGSGEASAWYKICFPLILKCSLKIMWKNNVLGIYFSYTKS